MRNIALTIIAALFLLLAAQAWSQPYTHGGVIGYAQNNPAASPTLKAGQSYPLRMDSSGALILAATPTATATP
jgi:hypothetical protein